MTYVFSLWCCVRRPLYTNITFAPSHPFPPSFLFLPIFLILPSCVAKKKKHIFSSLWPGLLAFYLYVPRLVRVFVGNKLKRGDRGIDEEAEPSWVGGEAEPKWRTCLGSIHVQQTKTCQCLSSQEEVCEANDVWWLCPIHCQCSLSSQWAQLYLLQED